MSSFYGGGGGTSGSGFPAKNGTTSSPVILNTLDYGNYIINGTFLYTATDDEEKTVDYDMYVAIMEDPDTGQKVAKYEWVEGGIYYIYTITFGDDDDYQVNKLFITTGDGVIFIDDTTYMPTEGIENILYVGWQAVYRWDTNSQSFINLNSSAYNVWGNF